MIGRYFLGHALVAFGLMGVSIRKDGFGGPSVWGLAPLHEADDDGHDGPAAGRRA